MLGKTPPLSIRSEKTARSETKSRPLYSRIGTLKDACPASLRSEEDSKHRRRRSSAFIEVGLGGEDAIVDAKIRRNSRPKLQVRFSNQVEFVEPEAIEWDESDFYSLWWHRRPSRQVLSPFFPTLPRILFFAILLIVLVPSLNSSPLLGIGLSPIRAKAGPVGIRYDAQFLRRRQSSTTEPCFRWSGQSAVVNGTMYYYGGRASTQPGQSENEWNNDLVALDLTHSWQISSPTLKGLAQPSGPPPVSLGYLWNSYDSLYLYGGEFSDHPATSPVPFSTWSYDIASSTWQQHSNPVTVAGINSDGGNIPVQRAAEGAGVSVPNIGRGFYFGGHLDGYTTVGWSQSIARIYLTSLLEYTFPGYSNSAVNNDPIAGADGIYRNITQGGTQNTAGFPERADGVLVYIPGFGKQGIILGLAGGTNATFTQMNVIDVYDIATSSWYKQATSGPTPEIRVNPCAVALSAADGSSTNVYMYGGQNLLPYGNQIQYKDMWILSLPSFTWIEVTYGPTQSVPPGRAGHMCAVWNAQMIVWGGYIGTQYSCESPGIYVFNTSALTWQNTYNSLDVSDELNRQVSQQKDISALQGSYGYQVPPLVQKVIGGNAAGGATVTAPAQSPLSGPLATGSPITFSVSANTITTTSDGHLITSTTTPTVLPPVSSGASTSGASGSGSPNVGAIVAGVIAGFFAVLAAYLGFCAWLWRKQLKLYKNHVAMSQRAQLAGGDRASYLATPYTDKTASNQPSHRSSDRRSPFLGSRSGETGAHIMPLASNNPYRSAVNGGGTETARSSTDDLMRGQEPSFLGVVLNPRRSLRVVNRD